MRYTLRSLREPQSRILVISFLWLNEKNQPQRRNDAKGKISIQNSLFKNAAKKGTQKTIYFIRQILVEDSLFLSNYE